MVYTGQTVQRCEDLHALTDQGACLDDLTLPGLLHVAVLRHLDTPLTPEKIWQTLHRKGERQGDIHA